jgi:hypothetical protein
MTNRSGQLMSIVNPTGLMTASRRCDLGSDLPQLADGSPRPKPDVHDRPLSEKGASADLYKKP